MKIVPIILSSNTPGTEELERATPLRHVRNSIQKRKMEKMCKANLHLEREFGLFVVACLGFLSKN